MKNKELVKAGRQTDRIMPVVFRYRMLILFFVLLVATGVFCGSVSADNPDVSNAQNLSDALNISLAGAAYANGDTVYLIKDVPLDYTINITAESPITLTTVDNDHTIFRSVSDVPLFNVSSGTLILQGNGGKNLTIDGNMETYDQDGYSLIYVNGGGLNMSDRSVLQNSSAIYGGGVYVKSGTFNMTGGTISGNTAYVGGGVYLLDGTFTITGGIISNNNAGDSGGGVYVEDNCTFNMIGGTISGNTAYVGGGVYMWGGPFTMTGGTISDNSADYGGGVYILFFSTFNMTGGTISNNNAIYFGGGVYMWGGTFNMTGGTISGNTAYRGGGVYMWGGTFNMTGGIISNNNAADSGGGVYLLDGTFTMTGGTISGNTAIDGGGVYMHAYDYGTFNMIGSANVDADNDVYLDLGQSITVTGALDPSAGARNITPAFTGIGDKVVEYGSVDISNWSSNFALNTTWALVHSRALTNSSNILSLIENITVTFYLENGETTPYHTITNLSSGDTITAPPAPTKTGYTFNSWNIADSSGTLWNFTTSTVSGYTKLYANWTTNPTPTPTPTSSGGGNSGNNADAGQISSNGNYVSKDGGLILHYPAGSSVIVTVFPDYLGSGVSAPQNVSYLSLYDVYSTAQPGTPVTLSFKVNASELDALDLLSKDISILHYYDGQWHRMTIESVELVDGEYWFTVMSTHTSPFMVAYNIDGPLFPLEGGVTSTPSGTPTTGPTDVVPTTTSTPTPTKTPSSPVPFIGIIAGLGAVVLLMRRT